MLDKHRHIGILHRVANSIF